MEAAIIKIGNSKGLRLSKSILEQYNISDKVEIILEKDRIILLPMASPRKHWDAAFSEMHSNQDDQLLIDAILDDETWEEWN